MINPEMITRSREFRGLKQIEFSKLLDGINQATLSRIERGIIEVTEGQLKQISKVLNFPESYFKQNIHFRLSSELNFRKRANVKSIDKRQLEATINILIKSIDNLFLEVELPDYKIPEVDYETYNEYDYPSIVAEQVRKYYKLGEGPIENINNILEANGIIVIELTNTISEFDGVSAFTEKGRPIIILNENKPNDRKRFNLAHELGHLVMHEQDFVAPYRDKEKEANEFAGSFLFPKRSIQNRLHGLTLREAIRLKSIWHVSIASIITNARRYGEITKREQTNLMIELSRNGWRKNEPGNVEIDKPRLLNYILDYFTNDLDYSDEQIAKLMNLSLEDFRFFIKGKRANVIKIDRIK